MPRRSPNRPRLLAGIVLLALVAGVALTPAGGSAATRNSSKVTLCHRVGGPNWVRITVAPQAALNGHAKNHELDIIPPFTHAGERFPGQNWDAEGQAIFANGCVAPPEPAPIHLRVTCVDAAADGTFTAVFGYASDNAADRTIAVGPDNGFSPAPEGRGQPTTFAPGVLEDAVRVTGLPAGSSLTWTVRSAGVTSTATATAASTPACTTPPPPKPNFGIFVSCVDRHADGTYDARFGYQNGDTVPLSVPVGPANRFHPAPEDRGQPSVLQPGRVDDAVTVKGLPADQVLVWRVEAGGVGKTTTASSSYPVACTTPPDPPDPPGVRAGITVTCVTPHANGTYDATFGYDNPNDFTIEIPVGYSNRVSPEPADRGQPTVFPPGTVTAAFTVTGVRDTQATRWTVASLSGTVTATATSDFPTRCSSAPPPIEPAPETVGVFLTCVITHADGSYDASFGYENLGDGEVVVPAGQDNQVTPGAADRGQPTTFTPGNVQVAFTVAGIARGDAVTWRVATPGAGSTAATSDPTAPSCTTGPAPPSSPLLRIDKRATPATVGVGEPLRYVVTVRNAGDAAANNVVASDRLPSNVALISISDTRHCRVRGRIITCRLGTLAAGARASVTITVRVLGGDAVVNSAVVGGTGGATTAEVRDRASVRTPVKHGAGVRARCTRRGLC